MWKTLHLCNQWCTWQQTPRFQPHSPTHPKRQQVGRTRLSQPRCSRHQRFPWQCPTLQILRTNVGFVRMTLMKRLLRNFVKSRWWIGVVPYLRVPSEQFVWMIVVDVTQLALATNFSPRLSRWSVRCHRTHLYWFFHLTNNCRNYHVFAPVKMWPKWWWDFVLVAMKSKSGVTRVRPATRARAVQPSCRKRMKTFGGGYHQSLGEWGPDDLKYQEELRRFFYSPIPLLDPPLSLPGPNDFVLHYRGYSGDAILSEKRGGSSTHPLRFTNGLWSITCRPCLFVARFGLWQSQDSVVTPRWCDCKRNLVLKSIKRWIDWVKKDGWVISRSCAWHHTWPLRLALFHGGPLS